MIFRFIVVLLFVGAFLFNGAESTFPAYGNFSKRSAIFAPLVTYTFLEGGGNIVSPKEGLMDYITLNFTTGNVRWLYDVDLTSGLQFLSNADPHVCSACSNTTNLGNALNGATSFSIEAWVEINLPFSTSKIPFINLREKHTFPCDSADFGFQYVLRSSSTEHIFQPDYMNGGTPVCPAIYSISSNFTGLHHVVLSGTQGEGISLYLDGNMINSASYPLSLTTANRILGIGNVPSGSPVSTGFIGKLYFLAIYRRNIGPFSSTNFKAGLPNQPPITQNSEVKMYSWSNFSTILLASDPEMKELNYFITEFPQNASIRAKGFSQDNPSENFSDPEITILVSEFVGNNTFSFAVQEKEYLDGKQWTSPRNGNVTVHILPLPIAENLTTETLYDNENVTISVNISEQDPSLKKLLRVYVSNVEITESGNEIITDWKTVIKLIDNDTGLSIENSREMTTNGVFSVVPFSMRYPLESITLKINYYIGPLNPSNPLAPFVEAHVNITVLNTLRANSEYFVGNASRKFSLNLTYTDLDSSRKTTGLKRYIWVINGTSNGTLEYNDTVLHSGENCSVEDDGNGPITVIYKPDFLNQRTIDSFEFAVVLHNPFDNSQAISTPANATIFLEEPPDVSSSSVASDSPSASSFSFSSSIVSSSETMSSSQEPSTPSPSYSSSYSSHSHSHSSSDSNSNHPSPSGSLSKSISFVLSSTSSSEQFSSDIIESSARSNTPILGLALFVLLIFSLII